MRTVALSLGLALLCLLCVEAEEFGLHNWTRASCQIAGKWHITAMASDSETYLKKKDQLKMAMANIEVMGKDLKISFAIPTPERCMKSESIYRPTSIEGVYYSSDRGNKTAQLIDTDGRTYAIIFATREKDDKILRMLRLYSRTQSVRPQVTALFKKFAKEKGFTDEMIWMLPRQEECSLDKP